jgi:hypothetical protein
MDHVVQNMMFYISLTGHVRWVGQAHPGSVPVTSSVPIMPQKLVRLGETVTKRVDDSGILKLRDLEQIIWSNLERMNSMPYRTIEETVMHAPYEWTGGRTLQEVDGLRPSQR